LYLTSDGKWVTRDIASLDFLWGIPLAAERDIVVTGWQLQLQRQLENQDDDNDDSGTATSSHHSHHRQANYNNNDQTPTNAMTAAALSTAKGTWWEKWVQSETIRSSGFPLGVSVSNHRAAAHSIWPTTNSSGGGAGKNKSVATDAAVLEQPTRADTSVLLKERTTNTTHPMSLQANTSASNFAWSYAPGRRLEGDEAIRIHIPLTFDNTITKQRSIARQAALREWELQTAHGLVRSSNTNGNNTNGTVPPSATAGAAAAATNNTIAAATTTTTTTPVGGGGGGGGAHASTVVATAQPPMLDGRLFFSANSSYPISVFSVIRYEPSTLCRVAARRVSLLA
jgi:hypothetical protein